MQFPPQPPQFRLQTAVRSDVGMRRATNQDSVSVVPSDDAGAAGDRFLMVADGMGAHAAGELASKMAIDYVPHAYLKSRDDSAPAALRRAVREANDRIHAKGCSSHEFQGMGTTCSCLVMSQDAVLAAHVGDSRVYRLRDGAFEQLTFDHSLVWEMAQASNVSAEKVPSCIPKNVITRSLGPHATVNVDLEGPHTLAEGDVFLLCSDGLTGVVDDPLSAGVLASMPPDDAAQTLIDLANLRGGPDNITVIVARAETAGVGGAALSQKRHLVAKAAAVVAVACLAGFAWFFSHTNTPGMLLTAAGAGAAIALGLWGRHGSGEPAGDRSLGGSYGKGPYRRCEIGGGQAAAQTLRSLVAELAALGRSASQTPLRDDLDPQNGEGSRSHKNGAPPLTSTLLIDWQPFAPGQAAADAAFDSGDYHDAIVRYSTVIRGVMRAVREDDGTHRYQAQQATGDRSR